MSKSAKTSPQPERFSVGQLVSIGLLTRLLIDTGVQIFFPFLKVMANGIGITTVEMGRLISLRSSMGLLAPLFGVLADRKGNRFVMRLGLFIAAGGYLLLGVSTNLWTAAMGIVLSAIGSFAFLPTLQAYLSARLPYAKRARGLGIVEYAWALSGIIGLFLVGQLIEFTNWRVPMFFIGGGLFFWGAVYHWLPTSNVDWAETEPKKTGSKKFQFGRLKTFFDLGENRRSAWSNLTVSALVMFAATNLFITYGTWLESEYNLGPSILGIVALVLGVSDLIGSVLVSAISDRVGKRRSVIFGGFLTFVGFLLLPLFNVSLIPAVIGIALARGAFEFTVVSNIPLLSEQVPQQRSKMMGIATAFGLGGTAVAGLTGPWVYEQFNVPGVGVLSATAMALSVLITLWLVREPEFADA